MRENRQIGRGMYNLPRRYFYKQRHQERLQNFTLAKRKVAQTYVDDLQKFFHTPEILYSSPETFGAVEHIVKLQCSKCYDVWEIRFIFARNGEELAYHAEYVLSGASICRNCKGKPNWRRK